MKYKNKIILLLSFLIIIIGICLINNINFSNIENLQNQNKNNNESTKLENKNNYKSNKYSYNEDSKIYIPKDDCISDCVVSFDDCTPTKCGWSNFFNFNNKTDNDGYNQSCSKCKPIDNVEYKQYKKENPEGRIIYNSSKDKYKFKYKNKTITLSNQEYMDKEGNISKLPKPKHLKPLNRTLNQDELNKLEDDNYNFNNNQDNNNQDINNENSNSLDNNNQDINNENSNSLDNNNQDNSENSENSNKTSLDNKIKEHISKIFNEYKDKLLNSSLSARNIGSNLNTSAHNIGYMNLDSTLNNLVNTNTNNRLMYDNPYNRNEICFDSNTYKEIKCPNPYDYKPPMNFN